MKNKKPTKEGSPKKEELKEAIAVLKNLEENMGKVIPAIYFEEAMAKKGYTKIEVSTIVKLLKKDRLIAEPREGFIYKR